MYRVHFCFFSLWFLLRSAASKLVKSKKKKNKRKVKEFYKREKKARAVLRSALRSHSIIVLSLVRFVIRKRSTYVLWQFKLIIIILYFVRLNLWLLKNFISHHPSSIVFNFVWPLFFFFCVGSFCNYINSILLYKRILNGKLRRVFHRVRIVHFFLCNKIMVKIKIIFT